MIQTSQIIIVSTLSSSPPISLPNSPRSPASLNGCEDRQQLRTVLESALSAREETDQIPIFIHNSIPADLPLIGHTLASLNARIAWTSLIPTSYPPNMSEEVAALAEFSTHILVLGDPPSPHLRHLLTSLNPLASLLPTPSLSDALSPASPLLTSHCPPLPIPLLGRRAGWLDALENPSPPPNSPWLVYRTWRPLHPERWLAFASQHHPQILRARGFLWLATRMDRAAAFFLSGPCRALSPAGRWWANLDPTQWPPDPALHLRILARWQDPFADRRQELALLPTEEANNEEYTKSLRDALDACLLSDEEFSHGQLAWRYLPDPTPDLRWSHIATPNVNRL